MVHTILGFNPSIKLKDGIIRKIKEFYDQF